MKFVIQRVSSASVSVGGETVGSIGTGLLILAGFAENDVEEEVPKAAQKIAKMRIFPDRKEATGDTTKDINRSVLDVDGAALVVSQFTLIADTSKGNRPSFVRSAEPKKAKMLYERFVQELQNAGIQQVETGRFGEYMEVKLVNDGPVTIVY